MLDIVVKSAIGFIAKRFFPNITQQQINEVYSFVCDIRNKAKTPEEMIMLAKQRGLTSDAMKRVHDIAIHSDVLSRYINPQKAEELYNKYIGEIK